MLAHQPQLGVPDAAADTIAQVLMYVQFPLYGLLLGILWRAIGFLRAASTVVLVHAGLGGGDTLSVLLAAGAVVVGLARGAMLFAENLKLLRKTHAEATTDLYGLLDAQVRTAFEVFVNDVYEDLDHAWLHEPAADGIDEDPAPAKGIAGVNDWFTPFGDGLAVHPYAADTDADADDEEEAALDE